MGFGPSPFPPIADYGFLSDCETTCLVAPSGNVEWMCLPRFDGPSVFASILDRDAGGFRLGPADVMVPAGRRYLPGTNVLETTWMTRMGWLIVRDALSIGPWHDEDERSSTHRRAPTDDDAEHVLLRTVKCVQGTVELTLECEPVFDYGAPRPDLGVRGGGLQRRHRARRGNGPRPAPDHRHEGGLRGPPRAGAHDAEGRGHGVRRALVVGARPAVRLRRRVPPDGAHVRLLARVAQPRRVPRPPVADLPPAQRPDAEGARLRTDGRADRGVHHVAARDARRRAQLGLPLHLDPRLHVHAVGALHARLRLGGQRLLLLHRRRRREGREVPDHVWDRR